jgi:hypothetical protein
MIKQTSNKAPTLEQIKTNIENEVVALERQIADTATELEAKQAQLAEAHASAVAEAAEVQRQIAAELVERKISEFIAVAAKLDERMTASDLMRFKHLAAELSFNKRLKQAHAAREHLIMRMNGGSVYKPPFPSWSAMASAWLIPTQKAA